MAAEILVLAKLFYKVTPEQVCTTAYDFAERHNTPHNFNRATKRAGRAWFEGFMKRNPNLSVRKPENTGINRVTAFSEGEVSIFFDNLETLMNKHCFLPSRIFNIDETGINAVRDPVKFIAEKGHKRVGVIASGQRGKNVTVVCAASGSGEYIPQCSFSLVNVRPQVCRMVDLLVQSTIVHPMQAYLDQWTNAGLFRTWLEHFVSHQHCSKDDPVLVILDNHDSHGSLAAFDYCRGNGIFLLSLPPHTSHRTQPLDVSFFGPLKGTLKKHTSETLKN
ncbi:uncharacterized protein LOC107043997 [Diachasma alloeum]|uniref:uncharacterized protein LOC107043997 n=1 Tax=Diachasma alloeum TaxID=454923 RepID=UPI0007385176|nr:uncharacterized protein LOC107043997 [Diachasma alloeum]